MVKAAIIQSSYIPWKGYFDIISDVDIFVFLEDVQYTHRDWRNRNMIKFVNGSVGWLTIPVGHIARDVQVNNVTFGGNHGWKREHREQLSFNYRKAPFFGELMDLCDALYENPTDSLSDFNQSATRTIADRIGIATVRYVDSTQLNTEGVKSTKLISICKAINADFYLSGPSARAYIDEKAFNDNGIEVKFKEYGPYKPYDQPPGDFCHTVSILDTIAHVGIARCGEYIKIYR